tara:strand:- start:114 stop:293 length:180 start_codon:yes stop_codon:yes gene_type:complete
VEQLAVLLPLAVLEVLAAVVLVQYQMQIQLLLLLIQEAVEADVKVRPTLLVMVVQELLF